MFTKSWHWVYSVNHEWIRSVINECFYLLHISDFRWCLLRRHSLGRPSTGPEQTVQIRTIHRTFLSCSGRCKNRRRRSSNGKTMPAAMRKQRSLLLRQHWSISFTKRKYIVWLTSNWQVQCIREVQIESYFPSLQHSGKYKLRL